MTFGTIPMLMDWQAILDLGEVVHEEFHVPRLAGSSIDDVTPQFIFPVGAASLLKEPVIPLLHVISAFGQLAGQMRSLQMPVGQPDAKLEGGIGGVVEAQSCMPST